MGIGSQPNVLTKICWAFICPVALLVIFILSLVYWERPVYNQTVPYPEWAHWLGWILVGISPVQAETDQCCQTDQGMGTWRPTGEKGDLRRAAQYRPWEKTPLQLKLRHWL